ncbi:hypothetical protein GCM10007924_23560 [Sneathiella chinensis]|uniref:TRAP transporter small permease protein n=1 Tax=Sneathiella chinensis TaxID=349750 RepID=A0ABQ5U7K0_9PROT|nr:hypothetical protein GCM10007924_23560 [Sneathiella chinensis]
MTVIAYAVTALSLLADILGRELFSQGIDGAPRFAVYAAIIAGFLGMSLAAEDDSHIRPQVFDYLVPPLFEKMFSRLADAVSALIYGGLGYLAVGFVRVTYENGDIAPVLDWPIWPVQLVLPYTFFSISLRYLVITVAPSLKRPDTSLGREIR